MKRPSRPLSAERSCLVGGSGLPPISLPPRLPPILHGGQTQKGNVVAAIWHLSHSEYIGYTGLREEPRLSGLRSLTTSDTSRPPFFHPPAPHAS